ncbi:CPBP family intramembrane glutamic endopeptidase [Pontibacter litorisediminis]|uniref:CPBP family intramembrane glutamic endopeptidase n=1 Tax=Pontibacter litorisediminis TaxID=1846260 RepID=UPI0023EB1D13|nr:type II CAAX endopeptidase family protein [Pontibacter litorisediminis]
MPTTQQATHTLTASRAKILWTFIAVLLLGYILFILPNLFFGITGINGGLQGINLLFMALFQLVTVTGLVYLALRYLGVGMWFIGLTSRNWVKDAMLGVAVALLWALVQFTLLIPNTGGAARADVKMMLDMMDGSFAGMASFIILGVVGGGITEEIFNRGFFINTLRETFRNKAAGTAIAALLSVLVFSLGHLPSDWIGWLDILLPTVAYTLLFLYTGRLTASMVAHSLWNAVAILLAYWLYY